MTPKEKRLGVSKILVRWSMPTRQAAIGEIIAFLSPDEQAEKEDTCCPVGRRPNSQCHYWDRKKKAPELPEELPQEEEIAKVVVGNRVAINQLIRWVKARE